MSFFGDRLRERRENCGLQRQELANRLGVCINTIGLWERGQCVPRSMEVLQELAGILQVPVIYFYESDGKDEELRKGHVIQDLEIRVSELEHSFGRGMSRIHNATESNAQEPDLPEET